MNAAFAVMWRGPGGRPISIGGSITVSDRRFSILPRPYKEEWNLKINGVKLADAGQYECIISTKPMQIKNVTLIISEPPRITEDSSQTRENYTEGSHITLECYAEGKPHPIIRWYKAIPGESGRDESLEGFKCFSTKKTISFLTVQSNSKNYAHLNTQGNGLRLDTISKESAGTYVCEASNGVLPNAKRRIALVVYCKYSINITHKSDKRWLQDQPEATLSTSSISQYLGRTVTLECYAEGVPLPSIIWTRMGRRISKNWKYAVQFFQENDNTLVSTLAINSLDSEDFGKYACESFNSQGQSTQIAKVYAAGAPTISRSNSTRDTRLPEGGNLTLICFARGVPKPTVTWYKVSNESSFMDFEEIGGGPELIIKEVTKQNSGDYKCIASSILGNSSLQINIQIDEKFSCYRSFYCYKIMQQQPVELQTIVETSRMGHKVGDEVILECIVRGSPEPTLLTWTKTSNENSTWEHMIEIHQHNDSLRKLFMKIESIDIEDFGEYICSAQNIHSSVSSKIEIYLRKQAAVKVKASNNPKNVKKTKYDHDERLHIVTHN
ncbi:hypothetical protein KUTeg_018470 [Tegillarca granosa]|uniref:Ig-like domain-containing protein n=1 Tax=Tegillarca granosa TaxID=220873 RepID=A0ABQ9EMS2_TEGGR|nr:hypothetical protein KUTeg_018470 [Tegillarca granosa]